jgi:hypothetical protein
MVHPFKVTPYLDKKKHTLIFFHLPKTGGTTLHAILWRQYRSENIFRTNPEEHWESLRVFRELPDQQKAKYRLITGHMRFGIHEDIKNPSFYITFLREPIKRIVSYYHYILSYRNHYLHQEITSKKMSLIDVLESGIAREFENSQTRRIAGYVRTPYGCPPDDMLDLAIDHVEKYFPVVGLTEQFDESLILMSHFCRWKLPYYTKLNTGKIKPAKENVSDETLDTIRKFNELDIQLYEYASQRLQQQILDFGSGFQRQMKMFHALNSAYSIVHSLRHRAR